MRWHQLFSLLFAFVLGALLLNFGVYSARALPAPGPTGPNRFTLIEVEFAQHEWWMARWEDDAIVCAFLVNHDGLPSENEVKTACDKAIFIEWQKTTQACDKDDPAKCPGFYFIDIGSKNKQDTITVKLPAPTVNISLINCVMADDGWCRTEPTLLLKANEPLPNEEIINIQGFAGGDKFNCAGDECRFILDNTIDQGIFLEFWANSTYGDSSEVFTAKVRVVKDDDFNRLIPRWRVDVFSTQWVGTKYLSCAEGWQTYKPEKLPNWLRTPDSSSDLNSNIPYAYLAENLIKQGIVDVSSCPNHGLNSDGSINHCGIEVSEPAVTKWQNRFDELIHDVAVKRDVPGQLLKNLFSRESQFWPGIFRNGSDIGLGQMTENGADTTLLWNPVFYRQFCPLVLNQITCESSGYANLEEEDQKILRNSLVNSVDARCEDCPLGIDLSRADFSVGVFAQTLLANCEQAGRVVENVIGEKPGSYLDYETMWKLTLVNYNAGSGCLSDALNLTYDLDGESELNWSSISKNIEIVCPGSVDYVNDISGDL